MLASYLSPDAASSAKLQLCPPSHCAHLQRWWARCTWWQVRLVRVCTPWRCCRRTRLTCSKSSMRARELMGRTSKNYAKPLICLSAPPRKPPSAIERSMAALVAAERHLWLTLPDIKDRDHRCVGVKTAPRRVCFLHYREPLILVWCGIRPGCRHVCPLLVSSQSSRKSGE